MIAILPEPPQTFAWVEAKINCSYSEAFAFCMTEMLFPASKV